MEKNNFIYRYCVILTLMVQYFKLPKQMIFNSNIQKMLHLTLPVKA